MVFYDVLSGFFIAENPAFWDNIILSQAVEENPPVTPINNNHNHASKRLKRSHLQ